MTCYRENLYLYLYVPCVSTKLVVYNCEYCIRTRLLVTSMRRLKGWHQFYFLFAHIIEFTGCTIWGSNPNKGSNIYVLQNIQTGPGVNSRSHSVGTRVLCRG